MVDFEYLHKGVCGLANAHRAGTMAGHLGAAVVAGYFFGEDHSDLPERVFQGVEGELERVIAGEEAIWFNARKAGVTPSQLFEPFPDEEPQPESSRSIVSALRKNIGTLKQSGHNTIFAAIAVRALHDHPEFATPKIVDGIRRLIAGFDNAPPGRGYYGQASGWKTGDQVELADDDTVPPCSSIPDMVHVTIDELIATASIRKQGFGGLWHLINHAAAIAELERLGNQEIARSGLPAHHHHIRLWRSLADVADELGPVVKSSHDPREPVYWTGMLKRDQARLTHRIKTLYGYFTLRPFIDDAATRNDADDAFLYLMD